MSHNTKTELEKHCDRAEDALTDLIVVLSADSSKHDRAMADVLTGTLHALEIILLWDRRKERGSQ